MHKEELKYLENRGYKFLITHRRKIKGQGKKLLTKGDVCRMLGVGKYRKLVRPRGGETEIKVFYKGELVARGKSVCSKSDNYCRETGRNLALAAVKAEWMNNDYAQ